MENRIILKNLYLSVENNHTGVKEQIVSDLYIDLKIKGTFLNVFYTTFQLVDYDLVCENEHKDKKFSIALSIPEMSVKNSVRKASKRNMEVIIKSVDGQKYDSKCGEWSIIPINLSLVLETLTSKKYYRFSDLTNIDNFDETLKYTKPIRKLREKCHWINTSIMLSNKGTNVFKRHPVNVDYELRQTVSDCVSYCPGTVIIHEVVPGTNRPIKIEVAMPELSFYQNRTRLTKEGRIISVVDADGNKVEDVRVYVGDTTFKVDRRKVKSIPNKARGFRGIFL